MQTMKKLFAVMLLSLFALPAFAGEGKVNINKADAGTLMNKLEGVDQSLANNIVSAREKQGAFVAPYDLNYVQGIDRGFFQNNFDRITVGDVSLADKKSNDFAS